MTLITKLQYFSVPSPIKECYSSFSLQIYAKKWVRTSLMETSYLQSVMPVGTSQVTHISFEVTG